MIYLSNHYSLLHTIATDAQELPDLQAIIRSWHGSRIRRIDRYIQLCLAGGLGCVAGRPLPTDTGVYLASGCGAVDTSARVMHAVEVTGQQPKPLHFVNTLGNSAGFYLTQLLGLTGNTIVVSAERLSFEAAITHACLDLQAGQVSAALVGGFDEVTLPLASQRERLGAPASERPLTEGSHWLLLERRPGPAGVQTVIEPPRYDTDLLQLIGGALDERELQLAFAPTAAEQRLLDGINYSVHTPADDAIAHGTWSGAALAAALAKGADMHLAKSGDSYCALVINSV